MRVRVSERERERLTARKAVVDRWQVRPASLNVEVRVRPGALTGVPGFRDKIALPNVHAKRHQRAAMREVEVPRNGAIVVPNEDEVLFEVAAVAVRILVPERDDLTRSRREDRRPDRHL